MKDLVDLHTHTLASGHAYNSLCEMVHAAALKKLPVFGISDHAPAMPGSCSEMYFCNFKAIPREMEGVRLLLGCELNIMDYRGTVDLPENRLKQIDYAVASLHDLCIAYGTKAENTAAVLGVMENPYVNIIGHPDDGRFPLDYEAVVRGAKKCHKLLEVNNSSLLPQSSRVNVRENYVTMLDLCRQYRVPVLIGSDAHFMTDIWNHAAAHSLLAETGFPEELVANTSMELLSGYIPALKPSDFRCHVTGSML